MSRQIFLLVGQRDERLVLEALKPEQGFDRVIGLSPSRVAARTFHVDYFATSDGISCESKEDEHHGLLSDWVAACLELEDTVFAQMHHQFVDELMASGQLAKVDFLFVQNPSGDLVRYASENNVSLILGLDVARWLHDRKRARPSTVKVLYAEYGTETRSADVTQALIANLAHSHGQAQVSNALCGCDPHVGVGKMLSVDIEINGVFRNVKAWEGTYLTLS